MTQWGLCWAASMGARIAVIARSEIDLWLEKGKCKPICANSDDRSHYSTLCSVIFLIFTIMFRIAASSDSIHIQFVKVRAYSNHILLHVTQPASFYAGGGSVLARFPTSCCPGSFCMILNWHVDPCGRWLLVPHCAESGSCSSHNNLRHVVFCQHLTVF